MSTRSANPIVLTYSSAETFWRCRRAYHIAYVLCYKPLASSAAASLGTALHSYATGEETACDHPLYPALCAAYETLPAIRFARREYRIVTRFGKHGAALAGKLDGLLGDSRIYELKTTGGSLDAAEKTLRHTMQLPIYWLILKSQEPAILDIIRKPALRQRSDETAQEYQQRCLDAVQQDPASYVRRTEIAYEQERVDEARVYLRHTIDAIRWCRKFGWQRRYGSGCMANYGPCEYKPLCWDGQTENYACTGVVHAELEDV